MEKRTKKDEDDYNRNLCREEPIKTEIIQQLRADVKFLLANQKRLLTNLMLAQTDLQTYREGMLAKTERLLREPNGVGGFYWDDADGWHRLGEAK